MSTTTTTPSTPNSAAAAATPKAKCFPKSVIRTLEQDKKATPKSKAYEGIPEDMTIVWSMPTFDSHDHDLLTAFAKSQGLEARELLGMVAMDWFEANRSEIEELSLAFAKAADTVETLTRKAAAAKAAYEKTMAMLGLLQAPAEEPAK